MDLNPTNLHRRSMDARAVSICLVGILAFTFSTLVPSYFAYFSIALCLLFGLLSFLKIPHIDKRIFFFFLFFILPFLLSLLILPFSMVVEMKRFDYSQLNIVGRLSNIIMFFLLILCIYKFSKGRNILLVFKWYNVGVFILLVTALWHAVSLYTGLVSWPFETRSHLHSAYGNEYSFTNRVTGIAREPSFFVTYVVDFIALAFIFFSGLRRNIIILFSCFMMLLSLSPSGYIVLFLCFSLSYFFCRLKVYTIGNVFGLIFSACLVVFLALFLLKSNNPFFEYIVNRVTQADASNSGRLFMLLGPFEWVKESNISSLLFGHGLKSYSIIGTSYVLPSGEPVHVTSNNMYVDVFWEAGIFGLMLMLMYFIFIFFKIFKIHWSYSQRFAAFFVFFDLVFSALFRADYSSLRFFIMLYLLFILISYDLFLESRKTSLGCV